MEPWEEYAKPKGKEPWEEYSPQAIALPVAGIDAAQPYGEALGDRLLAQKDDLAAQFTKPYNQDKTAGPDILQRIGDAGGRVGTVLTSPIMALLNAGASGIQTQVTQPIARQFAEGASLEQKQKLGQVANDTADLGAQALFAPTKMGPKGEISGVRPALAEAIPQAVAKAEAFSRRAPDILGNTESGLNLPSVMPQVNEGMRDVAQIAQKYKIPVSFDQISASPAVKNAQKISQEVPFSGQAAFREKQLSSFNEALLRTVGGEGNKFTPIEMDKLFINVGRKFDELGAGKRFNLVGDFKTQIDNILVDAGQTASRDSVMNFKNAVKEIIDNADKAGNISGERLGILRAKINARARKSGNPDTQNLLHDLENALIDTMTFGDDAASGAFSKTKQQYKNLLVIEPLVNKGKAGNISPALLQSRVAKIYGRQFTRGKAGEIGDLARVGHELLPELGGSDTAQKLGYVAAATSMLSNPASIPLVLGGVGANRLGQTLLNRNQGVIRRAVRSPTQ